MMFSPSSNILGVTKHEEACYRNTITSIHCTDSAEKIIPRITIEGICWVSVLKSLTKSCDRFLAKSIRMQPLYNGTVTTGRTRVTYHAINLRLGASVVAPISADIRPSDMFTIY